MNEKEEKALFKQYIMDKKAKMNAKLNGCSTCQDLEKDYRDEMYSLSSDTDSEFEDDDISDNYDDESFEDDDDEEDKYDSESIRQILDGLHNMVKHIDFEQNRTFSTEKVRDIERSNGILMDKILSNSRRVNKYKVAPKTTGLHKITSAAINRKKRQLNIDHDNQILLRKIKSVKSSFKPKWA